MECKFLDRFIMQAIILGMCILLFGCVSTPTEHVIFMGEGFQSSLPQQGIRVVVWGNHSGAVSRTIRWLHDHQILAVDPARIARLVVLQAIQLGVIYGGNDLDT